MEIRDLIAVLAVATTLAAPASAEDAAPEARLGVTVGSRVRLQAPTLLRGGRLEGVVTAADERSLTLAPEGGLPMVVPREAIEKLEVSAGRQRSNVLKSTAIGAAVGVVSGMILPVDPSNCSPQSGNLCSRGQAVGQGAATGALLGALIGALHKTDRWLQVPSTTWSLAVQPTPKGMGGTISVSF